jgi:hypothetical protein
VTATAILIVTVLCTAGASLLATGLVLAASGPDSAMARAWVRLRAWWVRHTFKAPREP